MPWGLARLWAATVLLALACCAAAQAAPPSQTVILKERPGRLDARGIARVWVDPRGDATIEDVSLGGAAQNFRPAETGAIYRLGQTGALWMHLRLQRSAQANDDWVLEVPMPMVDHVTVFQAEGKRWRAQAAGDTLPVRDWVEPGRYPSFHMDLPAGEARDVFVRVQHATPSSLPVVLDTAAGYSRHQQLEYLVLGAGFGAMLLLIAGSLARSLVYREGVFAWYAAYAALTGLAVACYTGVTGHLIWPESALMGDVVMPVLACAAVGAAMLFVRTILGLRRRLPRLDRLLQVLGVLALVLSAAPALLPKSASVAVVSTCMVVGSLASLFAAVLAWRRGDGVARWVVAAYLLTAVAALMGVLRVLGWVAVSFVTQYGIVVAMAAQVPLLLVALFIRARDRHTAQVREQALLTQDALTGLLAPHLFTDRLRQAVARQRREGEGAAVMYIDLVNHARIRDYFGTATAEQSLLRSVIKLRRLLRDVDTVARVGEARFGVILEGASSRASVTERASRLIAAGLMPLPGLKPHVTLQFHVAALMLNERALEAQEVEAALAAQLARMSPRTRRPIRFVEEQAAPEAGDSSLFPADAEPARASQQLAA